MNWRRGLVVVVVLALCWVGYTAYVFNAGALASNQETLVMTSGEAAPGGELSAHVVVQNHASGDPLPDSEVAVAVVRNGTETVVDRGQTDANGSYTATVSVPNESGDYELRVRADSQIGSDTTTANLAVERDYSILVQTDKPVYQPGQDIQIRGVVRDRTGGAMSGDATVSVTDPEGNRIYSRPVALSEFGMGNATVPIAAVAPTGNYRVNVAYDNETRTSTVSVREYQTPRFDVRFRPDSSYYRPGETLRATVVSEYFFGEPVENATVEVTGEGYVGDFEEFASVETTTDEQGVATVDIALPSYFVGLPEESGKGVAVLNVSVTDDAGHTETITRDVPIAQQDLLVDAFAAGDELVPGVANTVYVTTEYPDGTPAQATVRIGDDTVETNRYGVGVYEYTPEDEYDQELRLQARAGDATGSEEVYFRTERGGQIALRVEGATHEVGDTVVGQAIVPNTTQSVYVDVVSGRQTLLTKRIAVEGNSANFSLSVPQGARGETTIRAWAIGRNNRVGAVERTILVEPASTVNVTVSSGQGTYRPGKNAMFTVETSRDGEPVPAAVGVDIVDESVFSVEEQRAGFAAVHYDIEQDLQRPELFVHGYERGRNVTADGGSDPTGGADAELAREASVARLSSDSARVTRNTFEQKRQKLQQRQERTKRTNGLLLLLAMAVIPVGFTVLAGRRRGPREFATRFGVTTVVSAVAAAALGGVGALLIGLFHGIGFLLVLGLALVAVLAGVGYLIVQQPSLSAVDRRFATALGGVVALIALGLGLGWAGVLSIGRIDPALWAGVVVALLALPLSYAAAAEDDDGHSKAAAVVVLSVLVLVVTVSVGGAFVFGLGAEAGADSAAMQSGGGDAGGVGGDGSSATGGDGGPTDVRQYFPETAASRTVVTGSDGAATMRVGMADTITTWRVSSLASTRAGSLGTDRSSARVFQPFFVKPDIPLALTQNDTVRVPVSVFNYENTSTTVTVELRAADWYEAENRTATVALGPNSVGSVAFDVTATRNGEYPLTVVATSQRTDGNTSVDAVRKSVTVDPYGRQRSVARSGQLDGTTQVSVAVPERTVPNSSQTVLRTYPGAYGQVVGGMGALLEMPTGCFEQTSSSLYPNVLALQYMEETGQTSPEVRMRAERFIASGYQRILTFETETRGGYSLFGDNPPETLLTAYGLMELSDMNEVYTVDGRTVTDMQSFLRDRQASDGSWGTGRGLEYPLGVGSDDVSTTAYVTWSLAHSGADGEAVDGGTQYVRNNIDVGSASTTKLAVALNMLATAERSPDLRTEIADELTSRAVREDGRVHWERSASSSEGDERSYRSGDRSVLRTALATNALLAESAGVGLTDGALTWIVEQKSGDGGWGGTQNTVWALKTLVNARTGGEEIQPGTIEVRRDGETVATRQITEQNRDEVQTFVLPTEPGDNEYTVTGPEGSLYYELATTYHEPWSDRAGDGGGERDGPISMSVQYDRTNLTVDDTVTATVDLTSREGTIGTALASLGVPPGFTVEESTLRELVETDRISRYELRGRQLVLYAENLRGTRTLSYDLRATTPVEASTGSASVYDYYDPDTEAVDAPVTMHVTAGDADEAVEGENESERTAG